MANLFVGWTILGLALLAAGVPAGAAYQFTLLGDRSFGTPAINNAGHVAYYSATANGQGGLYFWDGAQGRVAIPNDSASLIASLPVINDNDRLAMSRSITQQIM